MIEKDAIIHVSWNTPSKKIGVAHSKYGEVIVKEVRVVEIIFVWIGRFFRLILQSHQMKIFHLINLILLNRWEMEKK